MLISHSHAVAQSSNSDDIWFKNALQVADISGEKANAMGMEFYEGTKNFKKDISKAIRLFEIGTQKHNYKHCYWNLASIYGPETNYTNFAKAVVNAQKCVELFPSSSYEHQTSLYNLGYMYQYGGYGLKRNLPNAIKWYKKSFALGDSEAAYQLAMIYVRGGDGIAPDKSLVKSYFEKSANLGNDGSKELVRIINRDGVDFLIKVIIEEDIY